MIRLDKFLALSGERSRSEAARAVRAGQVCVNGLMARDPAMKVSEEAEVTLNGVLVRDQTYQYYMVFKPAGVLTAARDSRARTVMALLPEAFLKRKVLPVGRLDKDTTGLLLLTNDGALAHALLDPKRHVWKRYIAVVEGCLDEADAEAFAAGMQLSDFVAKPAALKILRADAEESEAAVELREGKFHQVKRMFSARGHEVKTLHRAAFGPLSLPDGMQAGEWRELTQEQVAALKAAVAKTSEEG